MKKKIIIIVTCVISFLIILLLSIFLIKNNLKKKDLVVEQLGSIKTEELTVFTDALNETPYYSSLHYADNQTIYGSLIDDNNQNFGIMSTIGLFSYNVENSEFNYYEYNKVNNRIMDFVFYNDKFYCIEVSANSEECKWQIIIYDKEFKNKKVLEEGSIYNNLKYPRIFLENGIVYILAFDNVDQEITNCHFYTIENDNLNNIYDLSFDASDKNNEAIYDLSFASVNDKKIYFLTINGDYDYIYELDTTTKEKKKIYENYYNEENGYIYAYYKLKNGLFVQNIYPDNSYSGSLNYLSNNKAYKMDGTINTQLNEHDNLLIFHNNDDSFAIFDESSLKYYKFKKLDVETYPKYLIVQGKIILKGYDGKFYITDNIENYIS